MSREEFLKRGAVGIMATLALFVAGCGGEEDNGEEDDEGEDEED